MLIEFHLWLTTAELEAEMFFLLEINIKLLECNIIQHMIALIIKMVQQMFII